MTSFNRKINISLCLAVLVLLAGSALAQDNAGAISPSLVLNGRNVLSLSHWNVKGARLLCVVSTSEPKGEQEFDVFREAQDRLVPVFSKKGDLIVSMAPLSSYNGRLLVTWSGGSAYYFRIFAYVNGQVKQVLDESSKLSPEVLYDDQGRESILITEPRMEHGKWTSVHGTTTVFKWKEHGYGKIGTIPWKKRFLCHTTESCAALSKSTAKVLGEAAAN